jgi:hypothetical protein
VIVPDIVLYIKSWEGYAVFLMPFFSDSFWQYRVHQTPYLHQHTGTSVISGAPSDSASRTTPQSCRPRRRYLAYPRASSSTVLDRKEAIQPSHPLGSSNKAGHCQYASCYHTLRIRSEIDTGASTYSNPPVRRTRGRRG